MSQYEKANYPAWVKTDKDKRKFLVLDAALHLKGETGIAGAARVFAMTPQMLQHNLKAGFSARTAVYLEAGCQNRYTRFDFNPELLNVPKSIEDYENLYSQQ